MNKEFLRDVVKNDILVVSEVSEMLGVSKQQINNMIKKGTLIPAKETPNGYLFLRDDISDYLQRKMKINLKEPREILGNGSTCRSKDYFNNVMTNYERIQSIMLMTS